MAENPHYLMRCLETRNIMQIAEIHMQACLARRETRGLFNRADFPEKDPARDGMLTYQRLESGEPVLELKRAPKLNPELFAEGGK
jgi:succinate dehydrogenase/fumarate reductase flavoprotein subunit